MRKTELVITVASWEERFLLGSIRLLDQSCPNEVIMFHYIEYEKYSKENRQRVEEFCREKSISIDSFELSFGDPVKSWNKIYDVINIERTAEKEVIVDFTTMPREALWTLLNLLGEYEASIQYIYHTPKHYSNDWLSRDPGKPRLVYKLGGEAKLGLPTVLLVLTGFDQERVDQLIRFFDPYFTLLGLQTGDQFNNQSMNVDNYERYKREPGVSLFDLDAFGDDHGLSSIEGQLQTYLDNYNIVMSSLGPKLSAIALYKLHVKYPQTALAYAPSNEFNLDYSFGLGEMFMNQLTVQNL